MHHMCCVVSLHTAVLPAADEQSIFAGHGKVHLLPKEQLVTRTHYSTAANGVTNQNRSSKQQQ